jgi:CRISPR/Cas system CSM-associated protein Csm3 (group 7 of RAMP superfamily)
MSLQYRYKTWLMLEAETPLSVGGGGQGLITDRLIAKNAAGFAYIPGTGLAGALRHSLSPLIGNEKLNDLFGFSIKSQGQGSRVIINSAHLLGHDGKTILEGIPEVDLSHEYYRAFNVLPERDYVRINEKGTAEIRGKFDAELLYKGVRFVTSIELFSNTKDDAEWEMLINQLQHPSFRIGGGTRKGYGKLKVIRIAYQVCDLSAEAGFKKYLESDNSLNLPKDVSWEGTKKAKPGKQGYKQFSLTLKAKDFFLFGAGYGDDEADATYKTEKYFDWNSNVPRLTENAYILIPATSVKGALRHRVSFHYNKLTEAFADKMNNENDDLEGAALLANISERINVSENIDSPESIQAALNRLNELQFEDVNPKVNTKQKPKSENAAVNALFGFANDNEQNSGQRGNLFIQDIYLKPAEGNHEKVFDHVRIDRYTGGASDGALFQEKTIAHKNQELNFEILIHANALKDDNIIKAWENTLDDLCNGRLALGGRSTKGHGLFSGSYSETEI